MSSSVTRLQTEYLKNSFRMEEFTELDIGEIRAGYRADEDGLTMWKGHYLTLEAETKISWDQRGRAIACGHALLIEPYRYLLSVKLKAFSGIAVFLLQKSTEELGLGDKNAPDSHAHLIGLLSDPAGIDLVFPCLYFA